MFVKTRQMHFRVDPRHSMRQGLELIVSYGGIHISCYHNIGVGLTAQQLTLPEVPYFNHSRKSTQKKHVSTI